MADPYHLQRFLVAQAPVIVQAMTELRRGKKETHWMWFVFPQMAGLGYSGMAEFYALRSRKEAEAYLGHPILAPRLLEATKIINAIQGKSAEEILGQVDAIKLRSSLTLFSMLSPKDNIFEEGLAKFFAGVADQKTIDILGSKINLSDAS